MSTSESSELNASNTDGKNLNLALVVICCAQLMIVLDSTVVNVAIPTIHRALHFSSTNLEWLITAYSLTFGGLLLFGGRTGDLYGKRRMFMVGVAIFAVSSLLGGFAQNDVWLIVTRGMQGVGGAIAAPTALSLIATNFPEGAPRNRAMGFYAAMAGGGGAAGLLLGGILTSYVSWRWIFFINVPIAAVVLFLAPRALNESETTSGQLDVPGALTVTGGMLSLVY
ncbi:MAG: MFS transporter, partial [Acidimicrobiales bacterium]